MNAELNLCLSDDVQRSVEYRYARKHIDAYITQAIEADPAIVEKVDLGVSYLEQWLAGEYYEQKMVRLEQIKQMNLRELVVSVFVGVAYCMQEELFVSVTAQLAARLHFDDRKDSIWTVAEIVAVLAHTDAFDLIKADAYASLKIQSKIPLPDGVLEAIHRSRYTPPLVHPPRELTSNYQSPYLTFNDPVILGKGAHDGDVCLDTINTQNAIPLQLSISLLETAQEVPKSEFTTQLQADMWNQFIEESQEIYQLMVSLGNRFHLHNKVDKRGRKYAQGYHITSQGSAFKKAALELATKETVNGVPEQYQKAAG